MKTFDWQLTNGSRRWFLQRGSLMLSTLTGGASVVFSDDVPEQMIRIGLVTDLHYADKASTGSRHYRET